jgi:gluconokinase
VLHYRFDILTEEISRGFSQLTDEFLLLSIDVGTSGVRAALFDERGAKKCRGRKRATVVQPRVFQILPSSMLIQLVDEVVKTSMSYLRSSQRLRDRSIHRDLRFLAQPDRYRRGRTSNDAIADVGRHARRAIRKRRCVRDSTKREIHARTGCRFHPSYWPAKLQWLERKNVGEKFLAHTLLAWVC